ncbi:MFS transporter [Marinobacterium jannaschii]|uniref:MFS transporter n=1 Tax=Marinobacterium jannaschii TaxID=64970 RepID=UPI0009FF8B4F|nr:MFS transporter [Marinobacterium jannaschii]
MFAAARPLTALFISYALLILANGLFTTLLSIRTKLEGFSTEWVGFLMTAYYLGMFLGARYSANVVQRAGHIRAFAALASMVSVSPLIHSIWVEPVAWLFIRLIDGFCIAGLFVITESWLNARADNKTRGSILALYMVTNFTASGSAQFLLPLADPKSFELFSLASIVFSLSLVPLLLSRANAPVPESPDGMSIKPLLKAAPAGFWGCVCAGLITSAFFAMGPVYGQDIGLSLDQISVFMAAGIAGGMLLQVPIGRLSDRVERRLVMASVSLGSAFAAAFMVMLTSNGNTDPTLHYTGVFIYGALSSTIYSLAAAHANDWSDPDKLMQTSSGLLIGYGVGAIFGPTVASFSMGQLGPGGLFGFVTLNCLLLMCYAIWQSIRAGQSREKMEFVLQPSAPFASEELLQSAQEAAEPVQEITAEPVPEAPRDEAFQA